MINTEKTNLVRNLIWCPLSLNFHNLNVKIILNCMIFYLELYLNVLNAIS